MIIPYYTEEKTEAQYKQASGKGQNSLIISFQVLCLSPDQTVSGPWFTELQANLLLIDPLEALRSSIFIKQSLKPTRNNLAHQICSIPKGQSQHTQVPHL